MTARKHPAGRTLHVIDIENLAGGTAAGSRAVGKTFAAYRATVAPRNGDHAVIGSGPTFAVAAGLAWPGAQLVVGRGVDGADRALLDAVDVDWVASHYSRVVVASGDHAFAPLVWALRARGVAVVVVTRDSRSASRALRDAAMHRSLALAS